MTLGPTDGKCGNPAGGPSGMPLALRLSEGLGPLVERLRLLEIDSEPDGWPCVQMRDVTALLDVVDAMRREIAVRETAEAAAMALVLQHEDVIEQLRAMFFDEPAGWLVMYQRGGEWDFVAGSEKPDCIRHDIEPLYQKRKRA